MKTHHASSSLPVLPSGRPVCGIGSRTAGTRSLVLLAGMVFATALPAQGSGRGGTSSGSAHPSADSTQIVANLLMTANRDEIDAGRLAVGRATRADVKAFAQRMVDEHSKALLLLGEQGRGGGWMVPDSTMDSGMGGTGMAGMSSGSTAATAGSAGARTGRSGTGTAASAAGATTSGAGVAPPRVQGDNTSREALHYANAAAMKELMAASGPTFDQLYVASQVKGHEMLLNALTHTSTSNDKLQGQVTAMRTAVQMHLADARKLQTASTGKSR